MSLLHKLGSVLVLAMLASVSAVAADNTRPWTPSELVTAPQLNSQLPGVKAGKIVLIQVGFLMMYKMGHIPGSQYQEIIIYCGCCPWDDCPNIRPAFRALKEMGFSHLKVLDIPERLGTDWTAKGFPIVTGM